MDWRRLFWGPRLLMAHPAFRRSPARVISRLALWALHCLVRRPATITLGEGGALLRLPPQLQAGGSTALFVLREDYEPEMRWVERYLGEGMVVVDAGANLGAYSVLASRRVGADGLVLAFEPGAQSYDRLLANITLNHAGNVRAYRIALSDTVGETMLFHAGAGPVNFSIDEPEGALDFETVECITLDAALAREAIPHVDFLKLDVEGAEYRVVCGAMSLLASEVPPVVMFEVNVPELEGTGGAWPVLARLGYELFGISHDERLSPRRNLQFGNNIALPPHHPLLGAAPSRD